MLRLPALPLDRYFWLTADWSPRLSRTDGNKRILKHVQWEVNNIESLNIKILHFKIGACLKLKRIFITTYPLDKTINVYQFALLNKNNKLTTFYVPLSEVESLHFREDIPFESKAEINKGKKPITRIGLILQEKQG